MYVNVRRALSHCDYSKNRGVLRIYQTEVANVVSKEELEKIVHHLADDLAWDVRETAAGLLKRLLPTDFDHYFKVMGKMVLGLLNGGLRSWVVESEPKPFPIGPRIGAKEKFDGTYR